MAQFHVDMFYSHYFVFACPLFAVATLEASTLLMSDLDASSVVENEPD